MSNNKVYSMSEAREILDSIVKSNEHNNKVSKNYNNIAVQFIGHRGIGKTILAEEYCRDNKMGFEKKNLREISEETSLFGFPRKTYKIGKYVPKPTEINVNNKVLVTAHCEVSELPKKLAEGWKQLSKDTMLTYSTPEYVMRLYDYPKSILLLDETNRAFPHIIQSVMDLINEGKYANWSLPPNCTIVICNNPNDGSYNVTDDSADLAVSDRYFTYNVKGDIDGWSLWASKQKNIKEECINFLIKNNEVRDAIDKPSYRMWSKFFTSISHLDIRKSENYTQIARMAEGSVGISMGRLFKSFVDNDLDIIPSLSYCFNPNSNIGRVKTDLRNCIYQKDGNGNITERLDIKGLLGLRLKTFIRAQSSITKSFEDRLVSITDGDILPEESLYNLLRDIRSSDHPHKSLSRALLSSDKVLEIMSDNTETI